MGQRRRTGSRWLWLTMVGLVLVVGLGLPSAALGDGAVLRVTPPHTLKFGKQPYGSFTTRTVTIANTSERTLIVTVSDQSPDDFSPGQPGSTCLLSYTVNVLGAGESCTMIIGFQPIPEFGGHETATLTISAANRNGKVLQTRLVNIVGTGVAG